MKKNMMLFIAFILIGGLSIILIEPSSSLMISSASLITMAMAGAAISGTGVDTSKIEELSPDLLTKTIDKLVIEMRPNATPFDTVLRSLGKQRIAKSWEVQRYTTDVRGCTDLVKTAVSANTAGETASITVVNTDNWSEDTNILVQGMNGGDGKPLILHVKSKDGSGALNVLALNPVTKGQFPAITKDTILMRCGIAKYENDVSTDPYQILPTKGSNYCQKQMAQVEISRLAEKHSKEIDWNRADFEKQALYDFRRSCESDALFGIKSRSVDSKRGPKYTMNGIIREIDKYMNYTGQEDAAKFFIELTEKAFTDNNGSDSKIFFVGEELASTLMKNTVVQKQLEARGTEIVQGIRFRKIETLFGELNMMVHPLFRQAGWSKNGLILDMDYIDKWVFDPLNTKQIDNAELNTRDTLQTTISEVFTVMTGYNAAHMAVKYTGA